MVANDYISARSLTIGLGVIDQIIKDWPVQASVLDLGAGFGLPVTLRLKQAGFDVYAIEASPKLHGHLCENLEAIQSECEDVFRSGFFDRSFDAIIAIGLIFLFPEDAQKALIKKMANALNRSGVLLFSAPIKPCVWQDSLTSQTSISLGEDTYRDLLKSQSFNQLWLYTDEGGNDYFCAQKD